MNGIWKISLLSALVASVGMAIASPSIWEPKPANPGFTRVMTYNIEWFGEDANPDRIQNLSQIFSDIQPQVVALQEIQSKKSLEQIFDDEWEFVMEDNSNEFMELAVAVKKPYKIENWEMVFPNRALNYFFPRNRDVLRAVIKSPNGETFTVYCLHSKARVGGRATTNPQREGAKAMLAAYIRATNEQNVVVMGDLNDAPDDRSVQILVTGNMNAQPGFTEPEKSFLVNLMDNLWRQDAVTYGLYTKFDGKPIPPVASGARADNERLRDVDYRYPQDVEVTQIMFDQILVSPPIFRRGVEGPWIYSLPPAVQGKPGRTRIVDGQVRNEFKGDQASDHLPVFADIRLR
ncbi:MAG: endonuclease/exonuclease/phosphatase family protein [Fimbriimonadaceae bacterium]